MARYLGFFLLNYRYRRVSTTSVSPAFDETALVVRAKAGDQTAFNELVQHYDRRVFRMAKQITENDDDAEDVLQETFLKAYTHLDDFQGNSNSIPGWSGSPLMKP